MLGLGLIGVLLMFLFLVGLFVWVWLEIDCIELFEL